jgi:hypothetical protein
VAALRGKRVAPVAELPLRGAGGEPVAGSVGAQARKALTQNVAHMFRLDEDLSGYTLVGQDSDLSVECVAASSGGGADTSVCASRLDVPVGGEGV